MLRGPQRSVRPCRLFDDEYWDDAELDGFDGWYILQRFQLYDLSKRNADWNQHDAKLQRNGPSRIHSV